MVSACELDSLVKAVAVYRQGARVTRVAKWTGDTLPAKIQLADLPLALQDGSVQLAIEGENSPVAQEVRVGLAIRNLTTQTADQQRARQLKREIAAIDSDSMQIAAEVKALAQVKVPSRPRTAYGQAPLMIPVDGRLEVLRTLDAHSKRLHVARREAERQRTQLQEELQVIEAKLSKGPDIRPGDLCKCVTFRLTGSCDAKQLTVRLSYQVSGAHWLPTYRVRFDSREASAQVSMQALVRQQTGEDWTDAQITLSTVQPATWFDLPKLASRRIGRTQASSLRAWRPLPDDLEALFSGYDNARKKLEWQSEPVEVDDLGGMTMSIRDELETMSEAPTGYASEMAWGGGDDDTAVMACYSAAPDDLCDTHPAPAARRKGGGVKLKRRASSAAEIAAPLPTPPSPLKPSTELLDYGTMRLGTAADAQRGELRACSHDVLYFEQLVHVEIKVRSILLAELRTANKRAQAVEVMPPPPRCSMPTTNDGIDHSYEATGRLSIPSDGALHAVPLAAASAPIEFRHVTVPRESQDVYRTATLRNPLAVPLLPGPAEVLVGDDFLLSTPITATPAGGTLELGLGIDDSVKVARNASFREAASGLLKGSQALKHLVKFEVTNSSGLPIKVDVRESIPVVPETQTDVKVKVDHATPDWQPLRQKGKAVDGGYVWTLRMEPGARANAEVEYTIHMPGKYELSGGNCRNDR
jgi:hypothetical protein